MPDQTPAPVPPAPAKEPWWKWIIDDPKKAVRLAFFVLALVGYDQVAASRISEVKDRAHDAAQKAAENAKVVDDLLNTVSDVKILVGSVKAKQDAVLVAVPKPGECKCGDACPCKR
jgi:hypothetical protein